MCKDYLPLPSISPDGLIASWSDDEGNEMSFNGTVVQALRSWGLRWTSGEDFSPPLVHVECGHEAALGFRCPHCDRPVGAGELEVRGPAR